MLKKHPHTIMIKWFPEPNEDPATGIKTDGQPILHEGIECRVSPAGDSEYNSVNGNTTLKYGFKVYMDPVNFEIPKNAVIIHDGQEMAISRVDPYQKGVVLWL